MKPVVFLGPLFLAVSLASTASAEDFHYSLPAEFTDVSTDAPRENFAGLPPSILERSKIFKTYGLAFEDGAPIGEINVNVGDGKGTVSESVEIIASMAAKNYPTSFRLVEKVEILRAGVACGKVDFEITDQGIPIRKLAYVLPLGTQRAWIALEARSEHFEKLKQPFEESIAKARGLRPAVDSNKTAATIVAIGVGALVGVAIRQALRRRKRRPADPEQPPDLVA